MEVKYTFKTEVAKETGWSKDTSIEVGLAMTNEIPGIGDLETSVVVTNSLGMELTKSTTTGIEIEKTFKNDWETGDELKEDFETWQLTGSFDYVSKDGRDDLVNIRTPIIIATVRRNSKYKLKCFGFGTEV